MGGAKQLDTEEIEEIKKEIKRYINIPATNLNINDHLQRVSPDFYKNHSFIGTARIGHAEDDYQQALNPERATIQILKIEELLLSKIHANLKRLEILFECIAQSEFDNLAKLQNKPYLSPLERNVYKYIQEIEFYLYEHYKAECKRVTGNHNI